MTYRNRMVALLLCTLLLAGFATAQMGPGRGMGGPQMRGVWSPVVGSGAAYQMESKDGKHQMEIAVVGKETVGDGTGYWLETVMQDRESGRVISKNLMVTSGKEVGIKRMIVQMAGQEPMEFPTDMMMRMGGAKQDQSADFRNDSERVGSESITTPAGTFLCEHWRSKDKGTDVWIATNVSPYGMVKMVSRDSTMTLTRLITNARSQITGTPKKFNPMEMMRQPD